VKTVNAFILAAGLGERLRPITDNIPKPLLPILGQPLVAKVLDRVSSLDVNLIGINLFYKSEVIHHWIQSSQYRGKVRPFFEDSLLGTGGALKYASPLLGESVFLVHNADILSDIPLDSLVEHHLRSGNFVTLAVHDHPRFNTVWIDQHGYLQSIGSGTSTGGEKSRQVAYTGIAVYSPEFLDILPAGVSNVVDGWLNAVSAGHRVGTKDYTGHFWSDIGTPESYASSVIQCLQRSGEKVYIHPSFDCRRVNLEGSAVIEEGCRVEGTTHLKNCILLPGSYVNENSVENVIAGPGYKINVRNFQIMLNNVSGYANIPLLIHFFGTFTDKFKVSLTGSGGSDRKYLRVSDSNKNAVLLECSREDTDYKRHIAFTDFFRKYHVPVPELLGADSERMLGLFEDLGDISLYSWLQCRKDPQRTEHMYRRILDIAVRLHTTVTEKVSECSKLQSRTFDYNHLRWETEYFIERFVSGVKGFTVECRADLEREFDRLAKEVYSFPKTVVHRDFQSQNIMVTADDIPRILDYQGARMGAPAYDLVSLLWDPYFRLEEGMRERLVNYYIENISISSGKGFNIIKFRETLIPCRLQRHMQALGAYGFLANVKGKRYFFKFMPRALEYLNEEAELVKNQYPVLYKLVKKLI
jgi:NDP-sugar pyrophosphorylase family protein/thiamine kinase-like enzyme